jgi:hypothetical protein
MVMLIYWSENMDTSHEHKLYIRHHYWEWFGNVEIMYMFSSCQQMHDKKMKSQDWILQMLWKYAKFQISGSKVRNKNTVMKNQEQTK